MSYDRTEYQVTVTVRKPDRTMVERRLLLHIDEPDNAERQRHLLGGLQIIGWSLAEYMFPDYRPSATEQIHGEYMRFRTKGGRE